MLVLAATALAVLNVLWALGAGWGLSEMGSAGRPLMSLFAALLMGSTIVAALGVPRVADGASGVWPLLVFAPAAVFAALVLTDRSVLWGNFPPSRGRQALEPALAVVALATPGLLVGAA